MILPGKCNFCHPAMLRALIIDRGAKRPHLIGKRIFRIDPNLYTAQLIGSLYTGADGWCITALCLMSALWLATQIFESFACKETCSWKPWGALCAMALPKENRFLCCTTCILISLINCKKPTDRKDIFHFLNLYVIVQMDFFTGSNYKLTNNRNIRIRLCTDDL